MQLLYDTLPLQVLFGYSPGAGLYFVDGEAHFHVHYHAVDFFVIGNAGDFMGYGTAVFVKPIGGDDNVAHAEKSVP